MSNRQFRGVARHLDFAVFGMMAEDGLAATPEIENQAGLSRVTCGWKLAHLDLADVRRFWRDAHSPAIARRAGVYEYRHQQFAPVRSDLFAPVAGLGYDCPPDAQLMWQSDVRYRDQAGLDAFGADPEPAVKRHLLGDIEMIVDRSTTYLVLGDNGRTLVDTTPDAAPQGAPGCPSFGLFLRARAAEEPFRAAVAALAARWAAAPGVRRLRLSLFETPDMEAERRGGYPIKTHPPEQQYQAWVDLAVDDAAVARALLSAGDAAACGAIAEIHAYPVDVVHTFNYAGRPTLAGLRGYPAHAAIAALGAAQHREPELLAWLYGAVAAGGPRA